MLVTCDFITGAREHFITGVQKTVLERTNNIVKYLLKSITKKKLIDYKSVTWVLMNLKFLKTSDTWEQFKLKNN